MLINLFYAFCSGAFGAMMGASGAFVMTGCMCAIGMAALLGGPEGSFIHNCVTFGPMLLPAVTFAGGAAAAHYARWRRYVPHGEGRNIARALITLQQPDVILFGGLIGAIGYAMSMGMNQMGLGNALDTSATAIMIIALFLKLLFDHELLGKPDRQITRIGRNHRSAPCWQTAMTRSFDMALYGALIGGMAGCCVSQVLASDHANFAQYGIFIPFGVSCLVLLLNLGGTNAPVTHHITLCAAYAMAAGGSLGWAVAAAMLATVTADFLGRTFHMHGDCYVDPAAMAITVVAPIVRWLLPALGIYAWQPDVLPWVLIAVWLLASGVIQYRKPRIKAGHTLDR